jgi:hypothetical protein
MIVSEGVEANSAGQEIRRQISLGISDRHELGVSHESAVVTVM